MAVLEHLEPKNVFAFFEQICSIPHGSGNTKAISDFLVSFAKDRNLAWYQDELNNVIIYKPATAGYENAPTVILQGHMDMVLSVAPGCSKNLDLEGLDLVVDGDIVYAEGTSLGADNGIGVSMALAILDSTTLEHPPLEVVITVDEETTMAGAAYLDGSRLTGRTLINLDSEAEDTLFVGCAGGNNTTMTIPYTRADYTGTALKIDISGLLGGHSGVEIDLGRGNAYTLLGRLLLAMQKKTDLRIITIGGGGKGNGIPSSSNAVVAVADEAAARAVCEELNAVYKYELATTDPGVTVTVAEAAFNQPMDEASTKNIIFLLSCTPNGVLVMSADMPGLVQTSVNLGAINCTEDAVVCNYVPRSSVDSQLEMIVNQLDALATRLGGSIDVYGAYPGWAFRPDSPLRQKMTEVYVEQFGHEPKILAVHAGSECGMFVGKLPGLDCLCISPDMTGLHTYNEKLYIASTQRIWALVTETLRRLK